MTPRKIDLCRMQAVVGRTRAWPVDQGNAVVGQRNEVVERGAHLNGRREIDDRRLAAQRVQEGIGDDQARQRLEAQGRKLQDRGPVAHDGKEVDGRRAAASSGDGSWPMPSATAWTAPVKPACRAESTVARAAGNCAARATVTRPKSIRAPEASRHPIVSEYSWDDSTA